MNYNKIIGSAYSWISLDKLVWFLIFFWISLPLLMFLPSTISQYGLFGKSAIIVVNLLYFVIYLAVILGLVALTQQCLEERRIPIVNLSIKKMLSIVLLVFVEAFYSLVWSMSSHFRIIQILLLIATGLMYYYYTLMQTSFVQLLFALCATAYFILVIYNVVRIFFSTSLYCNKDLSIVEAVKESWAMTHNKFYETMTSIMLCIALVFILFSFSAILLGTLTSLVLSFFLINPLALSIGFKAAAVFALAPAIIAYHYAMAEVYAQLNAHNQNSSSIRRILAHKVLHPAKKAPARKLAKKKKRR